MKQGKKTIYRPNIAIVNAYTIIAVIYCVSFSAIFYSAVKNIFLAVVHLLALISVISNYFILRKTGNFQRATNVILTTGTCVVVFLFATGGWENTGFLWPFAYLPFAFFLTDKKQTIYWVLALFAGCLIIAALHFFKIITLPYSAIALFNYFAALLIFIVCMYFFRKQPLIMKNFYLILIVFRKQAWIHFLLLVATGRLLDNCYGDNVLLQQVWDNLISNAIKYSQTRKKQYIEIGSSKKDDEIIYWIKDNGVGFDMQYASKLFEVFQRLHDKSEFKGTGIGLALAKRIIEKHGGKIWAEGKVDEGSVFYFSIPANGVISGKNDY